MNHYLVWLINKEDDAKGPSVASAPSARQAILAVAEETNQALAAEGSDIRVDPARLVAVRCFRVNTVEPF